MIPKRLVKLVLDRDDGRCVLNLAGCQIAASVADHRVNRGMGGSAGVLDDAANLIAACGLCNGAKEDAHGSPRDALVRRGVRVLPAATHSKSLERAREIPVVYPDGSPYLLTSSGARLRIRVVA